MTLTRDLLADLTYLLRTQPGLTVSELVPRLCVSGAPVSAAEVKQRLVTNPHQFRREGESNVRGYLRPAGTAKDPWQGAHESFLDLAAIWSQRSARANLCLSQ